MSDVAIRVEGIGKRYRVGESVRYRTLRESCLSLFTTSSGNSQREQMWALQGVSCEVYRGEVLGLIGRNGAGKSTLLKILCRITRPSTGQADIYGRVGSLLEVGTGFHPELTGRENIFLNGAILGMSRREILKKFDEIVAFAEIEQFIDTPVKRFSSGMYVRLAFAVAAHMQPDILLVDEVLAVGDAMFQRKCLEKVGDMARGGRTVLFVSHNMGAVRRLCSRVLWLDRGRTVHDGGPGEVIRDYLSGVVSANVVQNFSPDWTKPVQICSIRVHDVKGHNCATIDARHPFAVEFDLEVRVAGPYRIVAALWSTAGEKVLTSISTDSLPRELLRRTGRYLVRMLIPGGLVAAGSYTLSCSAGAEREPPSDRCENAVAFTIFGSPFPSDEMRGGIVNFPLHWDCTGGRGAELGGSVVAPVPG